MFKKDDRSAGAGDVSIIGAGVNVAGDITFSGYLRIQGNVVGNITCTSETQGTLVVHGSGQVKGSLRAPNIVVGGHVEGPVEASGSIEIHPGASVVGDARYRQIEIHEGGTFDGTLHAILAPAVAATAAERPSITLPAATMNAPAAASASSGAMRRWLTVPRVASGLAVVLGLFLLWPDRKPSIAAAPAAATIPAPVSATELNQPSHTEVVVAPAATATVTPAEQKPAPAALVAVAEPPPAVPSSIANQPADDASTAANAGKDDGRVISIEGSEWQKPAGYYFVTARERVVLMQKRRGADGAGRRIEVPRGAKTRYPVTEQEVIRIAEGRNLDLYYQGRKLSPRVLQSGAWLGFVPHDVPAVTTAARPASVPATPAASPAQTPPQ